MAGHHLLPPSRIQQDIHCSPKRLWPLQHSHSRHYQTKFVGPIRPGPEGHSAQPEQDVAHATGACSESSGAKKACIYHQQRSSISRRCRPCTPRPLPTGTAKRDRTGSAVSADRASCQEATQHSNCPLSLRLHQWPTHWPYLPSSTASALYVWLPLEISLSHTRSFPPSLPPSL